MVVRAPGQGGILQGSNPSIYDPKNPIYVFIIQAGIILIFTRLLHLPLSKIRQPRVIAEVIGGILLGPSVLGRAPGFTNAIFPAASMATLSTAANIGLILFLFLVGLEVDLRLLVRNWRIALSVGAAGMALPFGLGCAIAYGLYYQFRDDKGLVPISLGTYLLFIGVAMAITAFPVLCRILTELKLLQTQVGVVVLSAGVANDVVGWILLALCVAIVNAGSGITALYVLLTCVAYVLFLIYAVRPAFLWLLKRSGSLHNGPTQSVVALTVLMVFASAFFTGVIGVHPIFGAFLMGLVCPHEGGFAIKLTEKLEDLVSVFFLPLYFALSGLSTNLGLLNNGSTWAYVIGVIAVAFIAKVVGGTLAARANKLVWRESFTIGVLMSCKGLIELIVLNIGLQAKILSQRTFTIFVVMALVTTFATTPLTLALFPPWYQKKLAAWKRGDIDWDESRLDSEDTAGSPKDSAADKEQWTEYRKLLVCLRLDSLPSIFTFVALLGGEKSDTPIAKVHPSKNGKLAGTETDRQASVIQRPLEVHGLRMLELTERLSSVMKESEADDWSQRDPVVNAFHTFGQLNNVAVSGEVQFVPEAQYAAMLGERASDHTSDMVLLPWSESGSLSEVATAPFGEGRHTTFSNASYNVFVYDFFKSVPCNAAVFINNGFGAMPREEPRSLIRVATNLSLRSNQLHATAPLRDLSHHIFFPYIGSVDDRVALRFVLRLAKNPNVTATILHVKGPGVETRETGVAKSHGTVVTSVVAESDSDAFFHSMADSLPEEMQSRVVFDMVDTLSISHECVERAKAEVGLSRKNAGDLVVLGRGHRGTSHGGTDVSKSEVEQSLSHVSSAMIGSNIRASILVIQAARMVL
ncbi:MAG: K(+)/H(+) antiporter [Alectoria sarmentosa]|nr:MAG: K(+)/H(+) antiporter [Alectoria sarmentosa]